MEKVYSNYNFSTIETILFAMEEDHSYSTLNKLKTELNKFFVKAKCNGIIYTNNTDKPFFGMRVYPLINGDDAMNILVNDRNKICDSYYVEFDSKLFDPMLDLSSKELTAILLHEIGHIAYDAGTLDEVRKNIDIYFADSGDYIDIRSSRGYKELIGYALKDAVMKTGSIFTKIGNEEIVADSFVVACGYGPYLESGIRKIMRNTPYYMNKNVDDRFITLAWVLKLRSEFAIRRLPALKTLNKAKELTASELERREIKYASSLLSRMDDPINEGSGANNIAKKWNEKMLKFKARGIRNIKDDIYELNLKLRCAESEDDLLLVINMANSDIAILQDYLMEDLSEIERKSANEALEELYDVRQRAAKDKNVRSRYSSLVNIYYPD